MPYVKRNATGEIVAVSNFEDAEHCHEVDGEDPALRLFLHRLSSTPGLADTDLQLVRVLEDLIDTLILKNVIHQTDLPPAAQKKLMVRKGLRSRIHGALNLLGSDDRLL